MSRLSRSAAALLTCSALACAVDRSGGGDQLTGASAGASNIESGGSSGSGGSNPGVMVPSGSAGVFGVATGNAGGKSGSSNQQSEAGTTGSGGASTDPTGDGGSSFADSGVSASEAASPKEAAAEAPSKPSCSTHAGGQTFTPNGAAAAHCYWPRSSKSDWQSALDGCTEQGGHLATITSSAENTFVLDLLPDLADADRIWLGGTDKKTDTDQSGGGPYQWITGEAFTYTPWADNNPDGNCTGSCGGRSCQCQHRVCVDRDGIFWDRWQDESYYAVCESEP